MPNHRTKFLTVPLQNLANEIGIDTAVHHLPPGTSKWNKIEHRLFSFISRNWHAKPLVSYRVIVDLISATTTKTGLTVRCEIEHNLYPKASRSLTQRWPYSTSSATTSMANGTTPSSQTPPVNPAINPGQALTTPLAGGDGAGLPS
jgi:hypothetical protein